MRDTLAIIIPAYKPDYLAETLESLTKQTNKDFKVYIGDDASPFSLEDIVGQFIDKLNIVYKKFDKNIGGYSLTKQWERCIEMSNEKWIWLFSDDDIAESNCIEEFNKNISDSKFYKFNTKIIDRNGEVISNKHDNKNIFNHRIRSENFINKRLNVENYRSFAVEYIFHRDLFDKIGFIEFPLAWASDDATWFAYSIENGGYISGINANVKWRLSGKNISSSNKDQSVNEKKINASMQYIVWLKSYSQLNKIDILDSKLLKWFAIQIASLKFSLSFQLFKSFLKSIPINPTKGEIIKNYFLIKYYHFRNRFN